VSRFISLWFSILLLLSNGMISNVVDLCCLNSSKVSFEHWTNGDRIDLGASKSSCCKAPLQKPNKTGHNDCKKSAHKHCEFDSWYYFTAKYFESPNSTETKPAITLLNFPFINNQKALLKLHFNSNHLNAIIEDPPHFFDIQDYHTFHCSWLI